VYWKRFLHVVAGNSGLFGSGFKTGIEKKFMDLEQKESFHQIQ
jgi:hypothetical protein